MFEPTGTSSTERLVLRPLTESDQAQALQAHRELAAEDFTFLLDWTLEMARRGHRSVGRTPATITAGTCPRCRSPGTKYPGSSGRPSSAGP